MGGPAGERGLYAEERRAAILQMLDQRSSLQVTEVADAFGVSRVTARARSRFRTAGSTSTRTQSGR